MMKKKNRRHFIKSITTLGIGAVVAPSLSGMNAGIDPSTKAQDEKKEDEDENDHILNSKSNTVTILQTTDVHCQIHPHDELFWENDQLVFRRAGGYAYMATMLKQLRKKSKNSFTIDTGDMFQGSELSVKTTGTAFVTILNALNYDLYLPGNWEVVFGKKNMRTLLGSLNAPKICANMYHDTGDGKKGELIFQPYQIWNIAGIKIGFLGYTDPWVPTRQNPSYSKGIMYTKPEDNLAYYVDVLKQQEQCKFIIIIAHLGLSQQIALANMPECEGVNYILGGDTHERVRKPIECKYAKVVEPGAFGSFIGKLDLTIEDGRVVRDEYELLEVNPSKLKPDPEIEKLIAEKEQEYKEHINTVIGYSTIPLYRNFVVENTIDTLILNSIRWKFPDIDIILVNGFRFCPPRTTRDSTGNIPITNGFIFDMLPVDHILRTAKVTGKQLSEWLEKELNNVFAKDASKRIGGWMVKFNGMEVRFNAFGEMGSRVQSIHIKGQPVDLAKQYSILSCERDGDPKDMLCRIKAVIDAQNTSSTIHDVLADYLKTNSPVTPTPAKNAKMLDAPDTLLSQVTGVDYTFR